MSHQVAGNIHAKAHAISCDEICGFLCDYLERSLNPETMAVFEAHISTCPPCAQYLAEYRQTILLSKKCCCPKLHPPAPMPDSIVKAVLSALHGKATKG